MIPINERATIATLGELKTKPGEILKRLSRTNVVLQRNKKPVAVMLSYQQYTLLEKLLDRIEDCTLGMKALDRNKKISKKDFSDIEEW